MVSIKVIDTPKKRTWGKTNWIPGTNKYVLFYDYDMIDLEHLIHEIKALIEEFEIGNHYIFQTKENGYHVICLDHFYLHEVKIITMSSSCDLGFVIAPRYDVYRSWVLRDTNKGKRNKPKYLMTIKSPYEGLRLQSSAHAEFLNKYYGCNIKLINPDGGELLRLESHLTAKRLK